jgi:hypothetical protein
MVWLVVAEMADGPQLRAAFELVQTSGGAVWVLETQGVAIARVPPSRRAG